MMVSTHTYLHTNSHQQPQQYHYTTTDSDELRDPPSLSSSPVSQYSAICPNGPESQAPYQEGASHPALAVPRSIATLEPGELNGLELGYDDIRLMNPDDWSHAGGPFRSIRGEHNRDSSLSSLGSIGPKSPYSHGVVTPRIAIADSVQDGLHPMPDFGHDTTWPEGYSMDAKAPVISHGSDQLFSLAEGQGSHLMHYASSTMPQRRGLDRPAALAPPIDFQSISRHGPDSVASSTIGGDSPATPALGEPVEERRRGDPVFREVPKFERSITDACQDSIYADNMAVGSSSPSQQQFLPSKGFTQALEAANKAATAGAHRLNVDNSASHALRGSSPFRNGSPLAPVPGRDFPQPIQYTPVRSGMPIANIKSESSTMGPTSGTPQTISPKESMLEMSEADDGDANYALFSSQPRGYPNRHNQLSPGSAPSGGHFQYMAHGSATDAPGVRVPQAYPFIRSSMQVDGPRRFTSPPEVSGQEHIPVRSGTDDDGGTYSCTYHGCELRFDSQKDLQAHKREGHRAAGVSRRADRGQNQQTQHGPHVCMRKNPSTNKPCGSKFSRPYDLTRHEDTIHNANKKKLRCRVCPEEKLFSRRDALNRHFKVCHEELYDTEFPKRRRANRS